MPTYYDLTSMTGNTTGFLDFIPVIDTYIFHAQILGNLILITLALVIFITFKNRGYHTNDCLAAAMVSMIILSVLFFNAHWISEWLMYLYAIICGTATFLLLYLSGRIAD